MKINQTIEKTYLGSLLLALYHTGNITKGNINKYWKKFHKDEHTLQEIVDYIEKDKKTKMDFSNICLVHHIYGKYAPMFTGWIEYENRKVILPINYDNGYEGILEHLDEEEVEVRFFTKNTEGKND